MKRAIILMFDSLNRRMLPPYDPGTWVKAPNFARLAARATRFDTFYAGSMPCIPARRELHTGRYNFLHRSWGPLEPFDESMPELLREADVHTHLVSDHTHYWEDGGATYHTRYSTWQFHRGQEGDPWQGVVQRGMRDGGRHATARRQDAINRTHMPTEAEHVQTRTVDAGLEFLETNHAADRWMLQLELFDPHEPFFTHQHYKELYGGTDGGFDWPEYRKVTQPQEQIDHMRREYAALVSMCDRSLGRVLDAMDAHDMWHDTMLIVNTDHGFLLGEHGWWAKSVMPWYNELVHLPFFLWDPRRPRPGATCGALAQTIDIAPTMLSYFDVDVPDTMQGSDLAEMIADDADDPHDGGLFGIHGGHVNVTDGRYVYMRSAMDPSNEPLDEHTLMPTHMFERFGTEELCDWEPAASFDFTKGTRTMRMAARPSPMNPWRHGTLLFDLEEDPGQQRPVIDDEIELRMATLLVRMMHESDAPVSQYARLGLPERGDPGAAHLLARAHAERAAESAQPLPPLDALPARNLIESPLQALLESTPAARGAVARHAPHLLQTEMLSMPSGTTLIDLAAASTISATVLEAIASDLAGATV